MNRKLAVCLATALSAAVFSDGFAQQAQVVPVTPAAPGTTRPDSPRKGGKQKLVLPLPTEYLAKDKDGDGQIGLYEWDRSKYAEFMKLDKNGDGFLTPQELTVKIASASSKRIMGGGSADKDPIQNPGNLTTYNQKIGETIAVTVTGQTTGSIWGTGTYTTDSDLATAAVHAGILKDGETGTVRVTIVESPPEFMGSTANGITSGNWQSFQAAYTLR